MTVDSLDYIVKDSLSDRVTKMIIHLINLGRYMPGQRLPSNEELASMLNVGRSSIRESLKELKTLGLVELRHGDGTYMCDFTPSQMGPPLLEQVIEVRRMIEVYSARLSAQNMNPAFISKLNELYRKMVESPDEQAFIFYDRQFHYELSRSSNNVLIAKYHTSIDLLFDEVQKSIVGLSGSRQRAIEDHRLMLEAIVNHNADDAEKYSAMHIEHIIKQIKELTVNNSAK